MIQHDVKTLMLESNQVVKAETDELSKCLQDRTTVQPCRVLLLIRQKCSCIKLDHHYYQRLCAKLTLFCLINKI